MLGRSTLTNRHTSVHSQIDYLQRHPNGVALSTSLPLLRCRTEQDGAILTEHEHPAGHASTAPGQSAYPCFHQPHDMAGPGWRSTAAPHVLSG